MYSTSVSEVVQPWCHGAASWRRHSSLT